MYCILGAPTSRFGRGLNHLAPALHQYTLQKRCLHMTNIERSTALYPHHRCIIIRKSTENGYPYCSASASHNRCQYMFNLERSKTLFQHVLFYAWCVYSVNIFLLHKSNTDEMQTPKQFTDDYSIWCPPYRSVE